uniref:Uncharacterized protein n=1 Tax=Aegilops tauschii subsp. strangulata TaxID=200361 RepID=A0A453MPL0_AEGTS
ILLRLPRLQALRWRGVLSDARFLGRYRRHHRRPPLLRFKKPDRIPPARFAVPKSCALHGRWQFLGYRHGLAGMLNVCRREVVESDPLAGQQHRVPFPPGICNSKGEGLWIWHAAVLWADADVKCGCSGYVFWRLSAPT